VLHDGGRPHPETEEALQEACEGSDAKARRGLNQPTEKP